MTNNKGNKPYFFLDYPWNAHLRTEVFFIYHYKDYNFCIMNSSAQKIQHLFNRFLMDYMQVNKHTTSG